jgi:ABC-type glycerol-3-phosphate transport system substrate-binding protein
MHVIKRKNKYTYWTFMFGIIASLMFVLSACGSSSESKEIVVTSFGGKYDEVFTKYVAKPFEEKNPGVKVKLAPYRGIAKLSQGGGSSIDIVQLDDFDIIDAANYLEDLELVMLQMQSEKLRNGCKIE